jgi:hypothetical protein
MFRRLSTGEVINDRKGDHNWTRFAFPTWWHYDVLRGLEYLGRADVVPDERTAVIPRGRAPAGREARQVEYGMLTPAPTAVALGYF